MFPWRMSFDFSLLLATALIVVQTADGGVWNADPNASALLPGQATVCAGELTEIRGSITGLGDAELFAIRIANPAAFSAAVVSGPTYPNPGLDTLLWLFNSSGQGVYANDDKGVDPNFPGGYDFTSELSQHNPNGPLVPGIYYLAISSYRYAPFDVAGNEIFSAANSDTGGGVEPSSDGALNHWAITSFDSDPAYERGNFTIALTGTEPFTAMFTVPEPATLGLLTAAATCIAGWIMVRLVRKRL